MRNSPISAPEMPTNSHSAPLPRLMLVSDFGAMQPNFADALRRAFEGGARFIQLREKDLPLAELENLAATSQKLCAQFDAILLINSHAEIAKKVGARGVHWPESSLNSDFEYSKSSAQISLNGISVHSVEAAKRAQNVGANYLVFGSVFATTSHPGAAPAGILALQKVISAVEIPVFAIGGIGDESTISACLDAGAHGIAVRSGVWKARDLSQRVAQLRALVGD